MTTICKARRLEKIPQAALGHILGRSSMAISLYERGILPIDAKTEALILKAIKRLAEVRAEARAREELLRREMILPPML